MTTHSKLTPKTRYPITMPNGDAWPHTVFLKNFIDHPNIEVGDWTYYNDFRSPIEDYARLLAPYLHPGCPEKLQIGRFCQIAHGTQFITSSANHPMGGVSTYPFFVFGPQWSSLYDPKDLPFSGDTVMGAETYKPDPGFKGDTVIAHDVWFGHQCLIMPGVTIGSGAIIGTGAVVTKDVAPYSIVAGNPARVIKYRFSEEVIADLLDIAWWDWPIEQVEAHMKAITSGDVPALKGVTQEMNGTIKR